MGYLETLDIITKSFENIGIKESNIKSLDTILMRHSKKDKWHSVSPANFESIDYLKTGNPRQQQAHKVLEELGIMEKLQAFSPLLAGTIPIGIDIETSDLDIIGCYKNAPDFAAVLQHHFGDQNGFRIAVKTKRETETVVSGFVSGGFVIEIFGQPVPVQQQNAWRHMLIENAILQEQGEEFRRQIIGLKKQGIKTELAFAQLLGLSGDPYPALLQYGERFSDFR